MNRINSKLIQLPFLLLTALAFTSCSFSGSPEATPTPYIVFITQLVTVEVPVTAEVTREVTVEVEKQVTVVVQTPCDCATQPVDDSAGQIVLDTPTPQPAGNGSTENYFPTWTPGEDNWTNETAPLLIRNTTTEDLYIILNGPSYHELTIPGGGSTKITVKQSTYSYMAWVGGEGPRVGSLNFTNKDKHEIIFDADKTRWLVP